jgi:hypothetical protein
MVILEGNIIYGGKKYAVILHDKEKKGKNLYRVQVNGIATVLEKGKDKWGAKGLDAGLCDKIGNIIAPSTRSAKLVPKTEIVE